MFLDGKMHSPGGPGVVEIRFILANADLTDAIARGVGFQNSLNTNLLFVVRNNHDLFTQMFTTSCLKASRDLKF